MVLCSTSSRSPMGVNKAYWGPENRGGMPQPAFDARSGSRHSTSRSLRCHERRPGAHRGQWETFEPSTQRPATRSPALPSLRTSLLPSSACPARRTERLRSQQSQAGGDDIASAWPSGVSRAPEPITGGRGIGNCALRQCAASSPAGRGARREPLL